MTGTFTTPDGYVTDHDPGGEQYVIAAVTAQPIPDDLLGGCAYEEGQTHRTGAWFYESSADDRDDDEAPTHGDLAGATRALDEGARSQGCRIYRMVPVTDEEMQAVTGR